jgi:AcrR family transcriptional regulator
MRIIAAPHEINQLIDFKIGPPSFGVKRPGLQRAAVLYQTDAMPTTKRTRRVTKKPNARIVDRRRRDLLDATFTLIAEKGFEGLRTRDIAARAGVNIATLHYHFGTKEALLAALMEYLRDMFLAQQWRGDGATEATLRSHLAGAWRSLRSNTHLATVLLELTLRAKRDAAARRALSSIQRYWNELVEDILRRGVAAKQLRRDLDPRAGAFIVTAFIMGATTQLGVNPRAFDFAVAAAEFERWLATIRRARPRPPPRSPPSRRR